MKLKERLFVFFLGCILCVSLSGCGEVVKTTSSGAVQTTSSTQSTVSTVLSEGDTVRSNVSSEALSPFEQKFSQNPIDADYQADSKKALSMVDMVALADRYSEIWLNEETAAYDFLLDKSSENDKEAVKKEQEDWVNQKSQDLSQIQTQTSSMGNMANLEYSSRTLSYYKNKTKALYEKIYQIDPNFSYHYAGKGAAVG
ncbi:MAG: hypothetical protein LKJ50_07195 [Clostridiales bacterium]|jgi:uncharacterized protein YecT (DUF1311 family)|nr:hypothetical protein [Clostridiales bacterium]MCI1961421.1 hypothetical protein [Clostridiales bacterium]MCI2022170.1 hypothetical protein [Clostridiales bacterium]MCI2025815.1 hypothetical protein [Clostridiales bacterium]